MSKFVIDFDGLVPKTIEPIEQALEEAYQRGINDGSLDVKERVDCAYQKGLDDAWECARKIFGYVTDGGLTLDELRNVFGVKGVPFSTPDILRTNTASEALAKLKAYEEQQKPDAEIKVGDEVINTTYGTLNGITGFYTGRTNGGKYRILHNVCGCLLWALWDEKNCKKTGKHSDAVEQLFADIKRGA